MGCLQEEKRGYKAEVADDYFVQTKLEHRSFCPCEWYKPKVRSRKWPFRTQNLPSTGDTTYENSNIFDTLVTFVAYWNTVSNETDNTDKG